MATKKAKSFTTKHVRDYAFKATIKGDTIEVTSKLGTHKIHSYTLSMEEWNRAARGIGNPEYLKVQLIRSYLPPADTCRGAALLQQIIDAHVFAITRVLLL